METDKVSDQQVPDDGSSIQYSEETEKIQPVDEKTNASLDSTESQHEAIFSDFQRRFEWVNAVEDPNAEYENLRQVLIDFAFARFTDEPTEDTQPQSGKFIEKDSAVLRGLAAKELEELKQKRREDVAPMGSDDDDILIDDLNIYGDNRAEEITVAESIVQSFFQPLTLSHEKSNVAGPPEEELSLIRSQIVKHDENVPSRLSQAVFDRSADDMHIHQGKDASGLSARKNAWLSRRFAELSKLQNHDEVSRQVEDEAVDTVLNRAIDFILRASTEESLEPAYLMLYKQEELQGLRRILYGFHAHADQPYPLFIDNDGQTSRTDFAVCVACGDRQSPILRPNESGEAIADFPATCPKCDTQTRQRPCSIQLGRALWDIIELHFRFDRLSSRVDSIVSSFSDQRQVLEHVQHLKATMKHRYEVEFLDSYTSFLRDIELAKNGENCTRASISAMVLGSLWEAYEQWAIDGTAFSRNVVLSMCRYACPFHSVPPLEWAAKYVSEAIDQPSRVLTALREFAIQELAIQPIILSKTMESLLQHGFVEFRHSGETSRVSLPVLLQNPFGVLSLLSDPTVDLYVDMPDEHWERTLGFEKFFCSPSRDSVTTLWNSTRWKIKANLINEILRNIVPVLKIVLTEKAEWGTTSTYLDKLEEIVSVSGYCRCAIPTKAEEALSVSYHDDAWKETVAPIETIEIEPMRKRTSYPRVLAVYAPSERDPIVFAQLSENGSVVRMWQWSVIHTGSEAGRELYTRQLEQLRDFTVTYRPHVVAVGLTLGAHQRTVHTGLRKGSLFETLKEFFDHPMIEVVWTDIRVPKSFGKSAVATEEFPTLALNEKVCVSVGRFLRDPLSEVVRLCNRHNDILHLRLVDEQQHLNQTRHRTRIDQLLSLWVSACGVDVNAVVSSNEAEQFFQYVSGLDYTKAAAFTHSLNLRPASVSSRVDLLSSLTFGDDIVQNCIGMLKVVDDGKSKKNPFQVCDATTVHPCHYSAVIDTAEARETLKELATVSKCYEQSPCVGKTLAFSKEEIENPHKVAFVRRTFRKVSKSTLFETLSNIRFVKSPRARDDVPSLGQQASETIGTKLTVHVGDKLGCRVLALTPKGMTVFTNKFVKGFIPVSKIGEADSFEVKNNWLKLLNSNPPKIRPGDYVDASVVGVSYDHLQLILSWKIDDEAASRPQRAEKPTRPMQTSEANRAAVLSYKASCHSWFRPDVHSGEMAQNTLRDAKQGEILIRHCDKNVFCMDFKLSSYHVVHVKVAEESIQGKIRYIIVDRFGSELIYEDLDHCYVDYVSAMLKRFQELEAHPRTYFGSLTALKGLLKQEGAENQKTAWRIFCSKRNPLYTAFVLYSPKHVGEDVQCWPFTIAHNGWRFQFAGGINTLSTLSALLMSCHKRLRETAHT